MPGATPTESSPLVWFSPMTLLHPGQPNSLEFQNGASLLNEPKPKPTQSFLPGQGPSDAWAPVTGQMLGGQALCARSEWADLLNGFCGGVTPTPASLNSFQCLQSDARTPRPAAQDPSQSGRNLPGTQALSPERL